MNKRKIDQMASKSYAKLEKKFSLVNRLKLVRLKSWIIVAFAFGSMTAIVWGFSDGRYSSSFAAETPTTLTDNSCIASPAGGSFSAPKDITVTCGKNITQASYTWTIYPSQVPNTITQNFISGTTKTTTTTFDATSSKSLVIKAAYPLTGIMQFWGTFFGNKTYTTSVIYPFYASGNGNSACASQGQFLHQPVGGQTEKECCSGLVKERYGVDAFSVTYYVCMNLPSTLPPGCAKAGEAVFGVVAGSDVTSRECCNDLNKVYKGSSAYGIKSFLCTKPLLPDPPGCGQEGALLAYASAGTDYNKDKSAICCSGLYPQVSQSNYGNPAMATCQKSATPTPTPTPDPNPTCIPKPANPYKPFIPDGYQLDGAISKHSFILAVEMNYDNDKYNIVSEWLTAEYMGGRLKLTNNGAYIPSDAPCRTIGQDAYWWVDIFNLAKVREFARDKSWLKIYAPPMDPVVQVSNITKDSVKINWWDESHWPGASLSFNNIALRVGTDQQAVEWGCPNGAGPGTGCLLKEGAYIQNNVARQSLIYGPRTVTGLTPNTTYYYRVSSVAGEGFTPIYSLGTNGSFKTLAQ